MITVAIAFFIGVGIGALIVKRKAITESVEKSFKSLSAGSSVAVPSLLLPEPKLETESLVVTEDVSEEAKVRDYIRHWYLYLKPDLLEWAIENATSPADVLSLDADYFLNKAEEYVVEHLQYGLDTVMRNYAQYVIAATRRARLGNVTMQQKQYLEKVKVFLRTKEEAVKQKKLEAQNKLWGILSENIGPPPIPVRGTPISR